MRFSIQNYTRIAKAALTRSVPVYAHFGVTHRCNLTCKMCGIWRYGNAKEELSIPEVERVAARMKKLGVAQVSIGGGEPPSSILRWGAGPRRSRGCILPTELIARHTELE